MTRVTSSGRKSRTLTGAIVSYNLFILNYKKTSVKPIEFVLDVDKAEMKTVSMIFYCQINRVHQAFPTIVCYAVAGFVDIVYSLITDAFPLNFTGM